MSTENQSQKPKIAEAPSQTRTETRSETKAESVFPKFENPFTSFDPMTYWTASQQAFQKLVTDAYGRAQSFADQYVALEGQFVSRAQSAVSSWAQLSHDAIAYSAQLSAEARKIGLETARKMTAAGA